MFMPRSINTTTVVGAQVADAPSAIANHCGRANRHGKAWKCNCPICGRHSLSVTYGRKLSLLIKCFHCEAIGLNDGYTEQRAHLVGVGLLEPTDRDAQQFDRKEYDSFSPEIQRDLMYIKRCYESGYYGPFDIGDMPIKGRA
jgi:hypothetical protein